MLSKLQTEKLLHRRELLRRLATLRLSRSKGDYVPVGFENISLAK